MTNRRQFMAATAAAGLAQAAALKEVRIGIIGTGNRGTSLMRRVLDIPGARVTALCDPDENALNKALDIAQSGGRTKPAGYAKEDGYRDVIDRDDVDAVIIAPPWKYHTPMAVYAMKNKKYVGVEVPAAQTVEECWELVNTHEQTKTHCMMLENWSFRRDNLAVLNMIRLGMFGEIVHCHAAHGNDCVNRIPWYFDKKGNARWSGEYLVNRNTDQYPTHSFGPVMSWMNINCGDTFDYIVSMSSRSLGINHYFAESLGADHPAAKRKYSQGDIASSLIKTKKGNTIVLNNDMQLPRPYDNRWMIQGTEGVYSEERNSIYLWRRSPKVHDWEAFQPYQDKYEHAWWRPVGNVKTGSDQLAAGHGGTDGLMLRKWIDAVRDNSPAPVDVYDACSMSVVIALAEKSIASGSQPVKFPDFTRGKWQTRKPTFALDML